MMQPIIKDQKGVYRFKRNKVVHWMLEELRKNGVTLNDYQFANFTQEDIDQFYQMIGYSVSGYRDLVGDMVSEQSSADADEVVVHMIRDSLYARLGEGG